MADFYGRTGSSVFYRLSAGALSYEEMLWYATYLADKPSIKPDILLVQLNYQNFANEGIRSGMRSLLSDPGFRQKVEDLIRGSRPESEELAEIVRAYDQKSLTTGAAAASGGTSAPPGYRIETSVLHLLDRIPGFERRGALKQSFVLTLIRCRSYFLHVSPSSRRSLGGPRITISRAALEDLAELCRRSGIRLILFQAPTNPVAPVYRTTEDETSYHEFTNSVAARYGTPLLDFEHSIPARYWGMSLNVPDPLHLSREGHRLLAEQMISALQLHSL
jgi:hypothetical protein